MVPHQHVFSLYVLSEKNAFNILNHTSAVMAICISRPVFHIVYTPDQF